MFSFFVDLVFIFQIETLYQQEIFDSLSHMKAGGLWWYRNLEKLPIFTCQI
jgi:hypothetical protein